MDAMADMSAVVTGVLRIIHPELFHSGYYVMRKLQKKPRFTNVIGRWANPFNAISVVANRACPSHRDTKSRMPYYDILASFGNFPTFDFHLRSVGAKAVLKPGGMVALCGHMVMHEAKECDGDRICYAWYMRGSVHAHMHAHPASWMAQDVYSEFVGHPSEWFHRPLRKKKF